MKAINILVLLFTTTLLSQTFQTTCEEKNLLKCQYIKQEVERIRDNNNSYGIKLPLFKGQLKVPPKKKDNQKPIMDQVILAMELRHNGLTVIQYRMEDKMITQNNLTKTTLNSFHLSTSKEGFYQGFKKILIRQTKKINKIYRKDRNAKRQADRELPGYYNNTFHQIEKMVEYPFMFILLPLYIPLAINISVDTIEAPFYLIIDTSKKLSNGSRNRKIKRRIIKEIENTTKKNLTPIIQINQNEMASLIKLLSII